MAVTIGGTTRLDLPGKMRSKQSGADATGQVVNFQTAPSTAGPERGRQASPWDLPRFSRTPLQ